MADHYRLASTATALAITVPARLQTDVNSLRSVYDRAYRKWPAHVNVLYPFVEPGELDAAVPVLKSALENEELGNLDIALDSVDSFTHRKNATIFFKPTNESDEKLRQLRRVLVKALGREDSDGTHSGTYVPHLTVGQAGLTGPGIERLTEKVEKLKALKWNIKSLVVLRRESSGKMTAVDEILLRGQSDAGSEEEQDDSTDIDGWSKCYQFLENSWSQSLTTKPNAGLDTMLPIDLTVLSYNLMVEPLTLSLKIRAPLLLENIASATAQSSISFKVLCLQEVNDKLLEYLLSDPFIQQNYPYSTHCQSSALPSHRNLSTFSSEPFKTYQLQFDDRHKSALIISFDYYCIQIANIHLTSTLTNKAVRQKHNQMATLTRSLTSNRKGKEGQMILAGDFNLTTSTHTIETAISRDIITYETADLIAGVVDPNMWEDAFVVHRNSSSEEFEADFDGEQGATFDRQSNPLAAMFEPPIDKRPQRYDRILFYKSENVHVRSFGLFGFPNKLGQCGSDHYGVCAEVRIEAPDMFQASLPLEVEALSPRYREISLIEDTTNLEKLIASYLPSAEDRAQREDAIELLRSTLSNDGRLEDIALAPLGSYLMDTYFPESDVDLLIIGSNSPREFFDLAVIILKALGGDESDSDGFKAVHYVNSLVPIIELVVNGIKFDLQYCQAVELLEKYHSINPRPDLVDLVLDEKLISTMAPASLRPLNTFRDTAYLVTTIADMHAYRNAHRFLSRYLKCRGLYSAKFGYLGGIHLSLMLNRVIKLIPTPTTTTTDKGKSRVNSLTPRLSPATIVRAFFGYYASFDWLNDIVSDPSTSSPTAKHSRSVREPVYIQAIFTPTARLNVASSCTRLSAQTFTTEFTLANEKLDLGDWEWCLRPNHDCASEFLSQYGAYARITLDIWDADIIGGDKVKDMVGSLESRIPGLLVGLGKIDELKGRAWPARFREPGSNGKEDGTQFRGYYLVGVTAKSEDQDDKKILAGKVLNAVRTFERSVRELRGFGDGNVWVEADVVPRNKIMEMNLVLDESDWETATRPVESLSLEADQPIGSEPSSSVSYPDPPQNTRSRKLRPAQDIISRIRWDPTLSEDSFLIGYEDRFLGVKEIELSRWKSEQTDLEFIPMHRIVWVRRKDGNAEVVWDREKRLDRICGSGLLNY